MVGIRSAKRLSVAQKFIRDQYIGSGQNTLYRMRWNPEHPATHQYATDINWANVNAQRMKYFYDQIGETGKYFDVDVYKKQIQQKAALVIFMVIRAFLLIS